MRRRRYRKNPNPQPPPVKSSLDPTFPARFFSRTRQQEDGCLIYTGRLEKGYGKLKFDGHNRTAQRVAWILAHGPVPEGMYVHHTCLNPSCVRVSHLVLTDSPHPTIADRIAAEKQEVVDA